MATNEAEIIDTKDVTAPTETTNLLPQKEENTQAPEKINDFAEIESLLKDVHSESKDSVERFAISQELFKKIRENLVITIKSLEKNPSMFTRVAEFWGELPLWQKILGGIAVTVPLLILGIVLQISFLLELCAMATALLIGGGIILDDHYQCTTSVIESLTKGILALADFLESTIAALENISEKLAEEVKKFSQENKTLKENVTLLTSKIELLDNEILEAIKLSKSLEQTKISLESAAESLSNKLTEQGELLDLNKQAILQITDDYQNSQNTLSDKIIEFSATKTALELEVEKMKGLVQMFQEAMNTMVSLNVVDTKQQQEFKNWLQECIQNKDKSFYEIAGRISEAEKKLAETEEKLRQCGVFYKLQLRELERQIVMLQQMTRTQPQPPIPIGDVRNQHAFFTEPTTSQSPKDPLNPMEIDNRRDETIQCH